MASSDVLFKIMIMGVSEYGETIIVSWFMPVMASTCINNDPYRDELDLLADKVAVLSFGSNMRASYRWGRALGMIDWAFRE